MSRAADWPDSKKADRRLLGVCYFVRRDCVFAITGDKLAAEQAEAIRSRTLS